jgi:hypothetical protein
MKSVDILNNLASYLRLAEILYQHEQPYLQKTEDFSMLTKSVRNEYTFITIELTLRTTKSDYENLYCKLSFVLEKESARLSELYCADKSRTQIIETIVRQHKGVHEARWQANPPNEAGYDIAIGNYLSIADRIAEKAMHCAAGDHYQPGAFSCFQVTDERIVLTQNNHMNAKSLNHKQNYSLHNLEFIIPLKDTTVLRTTSDSYKVGLMLINFSDRSSSNNKVCGDAIKAQILVEQAR